MSTPRPQPRLYLVTPALDDTAAFARDLDIALAAADIAAILLRLADADERTLTNRAKAIAAAIREQSGGLKHVRALGFSIEGGRRAQVSMNLVNTEATPIHRVLALIREEAARRGAAISGCEVVGLIPEYAMLDAAEHALQLESFRRDQVLELRLKQPPLTEADRAALSLQPLQNQRRPEQQIHVTFTDRPEGDGVPPGTPQSPDEVSPPAPRTGEPSAGQSSSQSSARPGA